MSSWIPWVIIVTPALLIAVTAVGTYVAVWQTSLYVRELWYRRWVRLNELTEVDLRPNGPKLRIRLRDRGGNKLVTALDNLDSEPAVWAVVRPPVERALASPECRRNPLADQRLGLSIDLGVQTTMLTDQGTTIPPVVYVPARRLSAGDTQTTLELRKLADGTVVLLTGWSSRAASSSPGCW